MRLNPLVQNVAACVPALTFLATLAACGASNSVPPASAPSTESAAMPAFDAAWDTDKDGTVDWAETKSAALVKFDKLDVDHDGTLDAKELAVVNVDKSALDKADTDHDGTLTKDEYLVLVQTAFKAADPDSDGTISATELGTKAGQALSLLVR